MKPDDFSAEERALLEEWKVDEPRPELKTRVLTEDKRRKQQARFVRTGLAAAVLLASGSAFAMLHTPAEGSIVATARMEQAIGDRATAVLERGADLSYRVSRFGDAELTQRSGDVFYRVERGGAFVVHTPEGEVRVAGTCFRVEVKEMKTSMAGLLGAGVGAVLATTVVVTVYEGKVVTASTEGAQRTLAAGESVELEAHGTLPDAKRAMFKRAPEALLKERVQLEDLPANATPEEAAVAHRVLKKQAEQMRVELEELRAVAEEAKRTKERQKIYDLPQDALLEMASKCELRWDMQSLGAKSEDYNPKKAERLHLSQDELEVVNRVMKSDHQRLVKELGLLYVEVTGDAASGSLAPSAMFEEIVDKAPEGEIQRVFQQLSKERAGLVPPSDPATRTPWDRVYRLMTGAGDALQDALAKELGPETAKELRALDGGWGSRSRSSMGCPGGHSED
jgi:hypothetical protein